MAIHSHSVKPPRLGLVSLMISLLLVLSPPLLRVPPQIQLYVIAVILLRLAIDYRGWSLPKTPIRILLTLSGIMIVYSGYRTLVGQDAGVALLMIMLTLKLIELRTLRDAMLVIFIGYFLAATTFLFNQSMVIGAYLFIVVMVLTNSLVILNHPGVELSHLRAHLRRSALMLVQALPVMLVLFIVFPRLNGPLWTMPKDSSHATTGLSEEMTMGNISSLAESSAVAFRATFSEQTPNPTQLYWRTMVLWQTDGRQWTKRQFSDSFVNQYPPAQLDDTQSLKYTVTLQPTKQQWIPLLDRVNNVSLSSGSLNLLVTPDYQVTASAKITSVTSYQGSAALNYADMSLDAWSWEAGVQLPVDANPRTMEMMNAWQQLNLNDAAMLDKALNMFREQPFYYTRSPPPIRNNVVDNFLFETQRGFCEHYAASLVTMMRAVGIPARIVIGYQGGEENPLGNYLVVRQSNAHAWAEVWIDSKGWVRVDPTAVIPPNRVERLADQMRFTSTDALPITANQLEWVVNIWRKVSNSWDLINNNWNQWVIGFNHQSQQQLIESLGLRWLSHELLWLSASLLAVLLLAATAGIVLFRVKANDPAARLYQEFCTKLVQAGITKRKLNQSPYDYHQQIIHLRPELRERVGAITEAYHRARYQRDVSRETIEDLRALVKQFHLR